MRGVKKIKRLVFSRFLLVPLEQPAQQGDVAQAGDLVFRMGRIIPDEPADHHRIGIFHDDRGLGQALIGLGTVGGSQSIVIHQSRDLLINLEANGPFLADLGGYFKGHPHVFIFIGTVVQFRRGGFLPNLVWDVSSHHDLGLSRYPWLEAAGWRECEHPGPADRHSPPPPGSGI